MSAEKKLMFRLGRKSNILIERKQSVGAVLLCLLFDHLLCAVAQFKVVLTITFQNSNVPFASRYMYSLRYHTCTA